MIIKNYLVNVHPSEEPTFMRPGRLSDIALSKNLNTFLFNDIIRKLKLSPGHDSISVIALKNLGSRGFAATLTAVFTSCLCLGYFQICMETHHSTTSGKNLRDVKGYRPTSLLPVTS